MTTSRPSLSPANPPIPNPNPCWYACLYHPPEPDSVSSAVNVMNALVELAQDFSPRYQAPRDDLIVIDVSGLDRMFGDPRRIGEALRRSAAACGLRVQIAIAATRTVAMVVAVARPGVTVIRRGDEAAALAPLPLGILENIHDDLPMRFHHSRGGPHTGSGTPSTAAALGTPAPARADSRRVSRRRSPGERASVGEVLPKRHDLAARTTASERPEHGGWARTRSVPVITGGHRHGSAVLR